MRKIKFKYLVPITILSLVGVVTAIVPPPPVNQNLGIYDTTITQFNESLCRNCHNSTFLGGVPTRHHNMVGAGTINPSTGQQFGCLDCHPVVNGNLVLDRNCIDCHNGTAFWGNSVGAHVPAARPHHVDTSKDTLNIGQPAQNRTCNFCHGSFVANYNDGHYKPAYNNSPITPFATFKATNATTGKEWGGCNVCHQPSSSLSPVISDNNVNHHSEVRDATPGMQCSWCHVINPFLISVIDPGTGNTITAMEVRNSTQELLDYSTGAVEPGTTNISISGTGCEKCHSVASIHNIQYNYNVTNGQLGFGHIGNNWDCNGCHAYWVAGTASAPLMGAIIPSLDGINPSVLKAGTPISMIITGNNFVNGAYSSVVSIDGQTYSPTSITDKQIVVNIPALAKGVHKIQLVKGDAESKLATLTVVSNPTITSAKLRSGILTLVGSGFGPQPTNAQQYVTITHTGKTFYSQGVTSWTDTQIVINSNIAANKDKVTVITSSGEGSAIVAQQGKR